MRRMVWFVVPGVLGLLIAACGAAPSAPAPTMAPTGSAPTAPAPPAAVTVGPGAAGETSAPATGGMGAVSVEDASGATIALPAPATRVACATSGCIEVLYSLGLEPVAVANPELAALPELFGERAAGFATIGGTFSEPSLEDIVAARPDLVIGWANDQPSLRDGLGDIPVFYVNTLTVDDAITELRSVGTLIGRSEQAEQAIARFQERLAAYQARITERRTAAAISGGDVNFELLTDQSLPGSLLTQIADYPFPLPAGAQHYGGFLAYSMEELLAKDPAVLLLVTPVWANAPQPLSAQLAATPLWGELRAVREERSYDVSPNWGVFGNLRGLELILDEAATRIYPELFPEPLP